MERLAIPKRVNKIKKLVLQAHYNGDLIWWRTAATKNVNPRLSLSQLRTKLVELMRSSDMVEDDGNDATREQYWADVFIELLCLACENGHENTEHETVDNYTLSVTVRLELVPTFADFQSSRRMICEADQEWSNFRLTGEIPNNATRAWIYPALGYINGPLVFEDTNADFAPFETFYDGEDEDGGSYRGETRERCEQVLWNEWLADHFEADKVEENNQTEQEGDE